MSAILFIPATAGGPATRRVDFVGIARRFAEPDEPAPRPTQSRVARIALLLLVLIGASGDLLLVTRSGAVAGCLSTSPATIAARQAA